MVDEKKFFLKVFESIKQGMIELECHNFSTANEIMYLCNDYKWL